jgi:hypothetical protein
MGSVWRSELLPGTFGPALASDMFELAVLVVDIYGVLWL